MRPGPQSAKARLRGDLLAARAALSRADRQAASRRVCEILLTLPAVIGSRGLSAFAPTPAEVDILPALERLLSQGQQVFLPWVAGPDLHLAPVRDLARDLAPGWRGVLEPVADLRSHEVDLSEIDVAVVPGIGFDPSGNRLGYGGGHFDRLLARLPGSATIIGAAFEVQVVDRIPREEHDVPVHVLVTEEGARRCRS